MALLHPSDVRPEVTGLGNIRIPAEALPSEDAAAARLVVPGLVEEVVGAPDETIGSLEPSSTDAVPSNAVSIDARSVDAATSVPGTSGTADYDAWIRRFAQITGLEGLILFIAGWIGRQRRLAAERRFATEWAARAPAPIDL